jgi:predicted YcjX-like family ATPase
VLTMHISLMGKGRHASISRVFLLDYKKKTVNRKFYTGHLQSYTMLMPVWTRATCSLGNAECRISRFQSSSPSDCRMFKSW